VPEEMPRPMKDVQRPDRISLSSLIGNLREGAYVIPDFQREFEWAPKDIQALIRSIFLDYYIGSLLLWEGNSKSFNNLACEPIYGYEGNGKPTEIVLDGQQRLTAIHYAFTAPDLPYARNKKHRFLYFINVNEFVAENYDSAFVSYSTQQGMNILTDSKEQYRGNLFPLAIIGKGGWSLGDWFRDYHEFWDEEAKKASLEGDEELQMTAENNFANGDEFGAYLRDLYERYQVSYVELNSSLPIEKICDIFAQINSRGIPLDIFDLLNALLKPKEIQLRHLWREVEPRFSFMDNERMNVYVLRVMSIIRQKECSDKVLSYLIPKKERSYREKGGRRTEVVVKGKDDFMNLWEQAVKALEQTVSLLRQPQEFGVISARFLPYPSILPAFAALKVAAERRGLSAHQKLRLWYWASIFTERYAGQVWTTIFQDYRDVSAWFSDDDAEPSVIAEFRDSVRGLSLRDEKRPTSAMYRGIFNLFILMGARDWDKGIVPQYDDLEDHHIVPKNWGNRNGRSTEIDTVLNRTPLSKDTNGRVIGSSLPNKYIPEMIKKYGEKEVRDIFESHLISREAFDILLEKNFTREHFDKFIIARQRTIRAAIESLLAKGRLDLAPALREMDEDIEKIEMTLRICIDRAVTIDEIKGLHFYPKVRARIDTALAGNPALDQDHYTTLSGQLEYFDLREIEDTIKSKSLWERFQDQFGSKEELAKRFQQLANLRNTIAHRRTPDEVTRNDGQAAIAWFRAALELEN